jgi:hypothetical protein
MTIAIEPTERTDRSGQHTSNAAGKRTMPMDAYRDGGQLIVHLAWIRGRAVLVERRVNEESAF